MFKPRPKETCESCNEFGVYSTNFEPHNFMVRMATLKGVGSDQEVVQYVCSQCREEWLYATDGPDAGWSLRRAMPGQSVQPIRERRRLPRPNSSWPAAATRKGSD